MRRWWGPLIIKPTRSVGYCLQC